MQTERTGWKFAVPRTAMLAAVAALALFSAAPEAHTAAVAITSCEQEVSASAVLTTDLICAFSGIYVTAPGVTIDLKGHTIRGDRGAGDYGIVANHEDGLTIKNGVIRNFELGIVVIGTDVAISNVVATGNVADGINVSGKATIKSSNVSGNGDDGFEGHGNGTSIAATIASGNVSGGLYVLADGVSIKSATTTGNEYGITVKGDGTSMKGSVVTGNGSEGIYIEGNGASLKGNRAEGNGFSAGASDLVGLGIEVTGFSAAPSGINTARGNDDPNECAPAYLC